MPTQLVNKKKIEEASYPAVYFPKENRAVALGDKDLPSVSFAENGDAPYAIGTTRLPYSLYTEPEIQMFDPSDSYLIELKTGKRTLLRKKRLSIRCIFPRRPNMRLITTCRTLRGIRSTRRR